MNISFIGAGNVARSLGNLFAKAGHEVVYSAPNPKDGQLSIQEACNLGEVVCIVIPFNAVEEVLLKNKENLKNKIIVDITNAINITNWSPLFLGEDSGGERVARLLTQSKVVKGFNTIFADVMNPQKQVFSGQKLTAFIASDDKDASELVGQLAHEAGFHSLIVGGIINSRYLEAMAHLNIAIAIGGGGTNAGFTYFQRK